MKIDDLKNKNLANFNLDTYKVQLLDKVLYKIKQNGNITINEITPAMANSYKGNFYGLLAELGIDEDLWLALLWLNGYENNVEYDGKTKLQFFDINEFEYAMKLFMLQKKKISG